MKTDFSIRNILAMQRIFKCAQLGYAARRIHSVSGNLGKSASRIIPALLFIAAFAFSSCSKKPLMEGGRAVYYWNTTVTMDSLKEAFIREHNINKVYLRYFDVTPQLGGGQLPNAEVIFQASEGEEYNFTCPLPDTLEVIPTVFILNDCMKEDVSELPQNILQLVLQMTETHDVKNVREIQIDCDWTMSTQKTFFAFMEEMHKLTKKKGLKLSSTIRLHQLTLPPPSCDEGMLMVYNTGDVTKNNGRNPILDSRDAMPYLKNLGKYTLPLSIAYPIYSWKLLYRNGRFVEFIYNDDVPVLETDSIRYCQVPADSILKVKAEISRLRPECNDLIVLFDFSDYNIKRYKSSDYEKMYQK